jgi:hypothetical protein
VSISADIQRTTLIITPGQLLSGSVRVPYRDGDEESLLRSYLVFVREMRGQRHARSVTLRSADIATIADHLDTSDDVVLGRLLDLMGVTRAQRKLLLAMLAAGALTIVATGSIPGAAITDISTADTNSPIERLSPEVVVPAAEPAVPAEADAVSVEADAPTVVAETPAWSDTAREFDEAIKTAVDESTVAIIAPPPPVSDNNVSTGTADDGSTVAVVAPPPPVTNNDVSTGNNDIAIGTADDGSTVAVVAPPLPPTDAAFGVDDDGFDVGVGPALPPPPDPAG